MISLLKKNAGLVCHLNVLCTNEIYALFPRLKINFLCLMHYEFLSHLVTLLSDS